MSFLEGVIYLVVMFFGVIMVVWFLGFVFHYMSQNELGTEILWFISRSI